MKKLAAVFVMLTMLLCAACAEEGETVYRDKTISSCGYSLILHWDMALTPDEELEKELVAVFLDKYPAIREVFGTNEDRTVTLNLTAGENGQIGPDGITMPYEELKNTKKAWNNLVWFFANKVVNGHPNPDENPEIEALSLGLQWYAEHVHAVYPEEAVWLMPYEEGQQLTDNGQIAAAFIKWTADTYGAEIPVRLNRVLHEGCYNSEHFWLTAVGNSLENLWNEYAASSAAE